MARFDSGGGGSSSLDDGGESTSEQQQQTEERRQLRRDADSDPMREQTETEEVQTGGPVGQTGGGSDPMSEPQRDTSPGASGTGQGLDSGDGATQTGESQDSTTINDEQADPSVSPPDSGGTNIPESGGLEQRGDMDEPTAQRRQQTGEGGQRPTQPSEQPKMDQQPMSEREQAAQQQYVENNPEYDSDDIAYVDEQDDGQFRIVFTEEGERTYLRQNTDRANQSVSFGTTGMGTSGTNRSRDREQTARANETVSLGTTGLGTSGTEQSRTREQTGRANETVSLGTTGVGTTQGGDGEQQDEPGLTTADRELVEGEIDERGREQFGDIDWSFGLGDPNKDEVEQFVDEQIGERGSEWVGENVSDPLREWGQDAKESDAFVNTDPPEWADYGQGAPDTVGAGEAAGNLAIGVGNLAEEAPRLPAAGLEDVETADYLLESTPVAGGSEEQFDRRVGQTIRAGAALIQSEAQRAQENPGAFAGEAAASYGVGRALSVAVRATTGARLSDAADTSAARQSVDTYTPDTPDFGGGSGGMNFRSFAADERGQADLSGLGRDADTGGTSRVTSDDLDVEPAENFDIAEERREFLVSKAERSLEQRREFEDSLPGDDGDAPVGEYTAPRREGGSLSEQEFQGVSGGPDMSRSGPTATQQRAFSGSAGPNRAVRLGPGEGIRARQLDTPTDDLRALDQLSRDLVDSAESTGGAGNRRGFAAAGAAGGLGVSVVGEIGVGEGTADSTQPATFSLDEETNRGAVDVGVAGATQSGSMFADVETVSDTSVEVDALDDSLAPSDTVSGVVGDVGGPSDVDTGVDIQSRANTEVGTDIAQEPATDLASDTQQAVPSASDTPTAPVPTTPPASDPGDPFGPRFGPDPTTSNDPDSTPRPSPSPSPDRFRFDDDDGSTRRRDRRRDEREGFARRVDRSLLNPFTGE